VVVFDDVLVKSEDGAIETRIVDGNVTPLTRLPDTVFHLSLLEFDPHPLDFQQLELRIQATGL
jgi:hypothetical protein